MSSNDRNSRSGFLSWIVGLGVGTAVGAALGVAWVLARNPPGEAHTTTRPRPVSTASRFSLTRANLPKRHLKVRF